MTWFKASGKLIYDPDRGKMKNRTKWWAIVTAPPDIVRYYRWWLDRYWWEFEDCGYKRDFKPPSWGSHVSVVRGEVPQKPELWKKHNGIRVDFEYRHEIEAVRDYGFRDKFYMIRVRSPQLMEIRKELGLKTVDSRGRPYEFHITIARIE